ncbi:DNA replication and repair protein RecO [Colwellia chukchiensis]|uniref:DNA repair protein RecO n=1 Tax=Colwellia chukchiensis TaxID=641665 RepID=A0A1H7JD65_9GAMM|nr:DNA repair protein RecO [Colwellia chukchiensis]SEK72476.1 DNA replication and repair protein RecO [Colwellia chukchiensis]
MQEYSQAAFVLHTRPYRENQLLVDLFTQHHGKLAALSYIGHTTKSSRKALLQPFLPISVTLKGQHSLKNLLRVEPAGKSFLLQKQALFSGFYINELLVKLLPENIACSALYQQYSLCLQALAATDNIEVSLREFELILMDELGVAFDFSIVFEHQASGFYYLPDDGFMPAYTKLKQSCYDRQHLQAIAKRDLSCSQVRSTFKALMRQVINHLLKGVPLNSRKLFSNELGKSRR